MASMLSPRAIRPSIFALPPSLRISAYNQTRPFSASTPRNLTLVDLAVAGPTAVLNTLHSAGLPWYAVLPTAAILVRGVLVHYLSALPARRNAQIQANLVPLAAARSIWKISSPEANERRKDMPQTLRALNMMMTSWWNRQMELHRLGKMFGAPRFHPRGILNFGMLIAFTEAIRMKCGSREGLLPLVLSPFEAVGRRVNPERFPTPPPPPATPGVSEEQLRAVTITNDEGITTVDLSQLSTPEAASARYSTYFDPTLQDEGLSWCLDLTAPDPTLLLPTALAVGMAANIIFRPSTNRHRKIPSHTTTPPPKPTKATETLDATSPEIKATISVPPAQGVLERFMPPITNLQRIGLCITILFWFAALKMPAAILLYFVPSLMMGWVQRVWLERKVPVLPPIMACRRPLRYRVKKEWND